MPLTEPPAGRESGAASQPGNSTTLSIAILGPAILVRAIPHSFYLGNVSGIGFIGSRLVGRRRMTFSFNFELINPP